MDDLQQPCGVTLFQPIRDDHFKRLMVRKTSGTPLAFRAELRPDLFFLSAGLKIWLLLCSSALKALLTLVCSG